MKITYYLIKSEYLQVISMKTKKKSVDNSKINKCTRALPLDLPNGWSCLKGKGPGPFITKALLKNPESELISWISRYQRKHHFRLDISRGSTWWAPGAVGWWIGILFSIGAVCFAIGAVPGYLSTIGNNYDNLTFFIGSLFFTTAAFLQYLETVNTPHSPLDANITEKFHLFSLEPKRIDWLSSVVQFGGTLLFNISTFEALRSYLLVGQINRLVWVPDAYGSICFLVASSLVWMEVGNAIWSWNPHNIPWWIGILNLAGSIFFGISAVGAFVLPSTGLPVNIFLVNMGTFAGGVCFLIGAVLLLPERTHEK
jgi:hypothetical protein